MYLALEELAGIEDKQEFEVAKGGKCFEMMISAERRIREVGFRLGCFA